MPQRHKELRAIKDLQASETAICHKHLNRIFPTFRLLQKIFKSKILKSYATMPQRIALLNIRKIWQASEAAICIGNNFVSEIIIFFIWILYIQ